MNVCNYVKNMNAFCGIGVVNLVLIHDNMVNFNNALGLWILMGNNSTQVRLHIYHLPLLPNLSTFISEFHIKYFEVHEVIHSLSIWVFG